MNKDCYSKENWIIHRIADDFELHDYWQLPITPRSCENSFFELFEFVMNFNLAEANLIVSVLFKIRLAAGSLMKWDGPDAWGSIPNSSQRSLRERLTKNEESINQIHCLKRPIGMMSEFKPVFLFTNEGLSEISNRTIFALIHLGLTKEGKVALGVFIKSRGSLSDFYMTAIKPFRHYIVYPCWFSSLQSAWSNHLKNKL